MRFIFFSVLLFLIGLNALPSMAIETLWGLYREDKPQEFTFLVRYLPSLKCLWITEVDINNLANKNEVSTLRISAVKKSDDALILKKDFQFGGKKKLENFGIKDVDFSGDYFMVKGDLLDKDGKIIASGRGRTQINFTDLTSGKYVVGGMIRNEHMPDYVKPYNLIMDEFTLKKYPFTNNNLGKSDKVIPPFEPVKVKGNEVKVWGRTYLLADNALPKQIIARQPEPTVGAEYEDILYSPVNIFAVDGKGVSELKSTAPLKVIDSRESSAVLEGQCGNGILKVTVRNTIEQDGVMKIDLKAAPIKKCWIKEFYIDFPIREEQAVLKHDLTDVGNRKIHRDKKDLEAGIGTQAGFTPVEKREGDIVWDSAETEKKLIIGTFQPMVWLGNEDRGLCWFADSDKGWILDDKKAAIQVIRKNGMVILRVKFINKALELKTPLEICFGLLATPVKPIPEKYRGWVFPRWSNFDWKLYKSLKNIRKIVEVGAGDPKFNAGMASPLAKDWDLTKGMYNKLKDKNGSTYMEYWCSDFLTMDVPEWESYFGEWIYYPRNSNWFHHLYKGHTEPSCAWLGFQRITPSAQDYKVWCLDKKLKELGLFSYYEDNSRTRLFDDAALGYGYTREDGKRQAQFDIWGYREYLKRIATVYNDNGYENMLAVHNSAQMIIPSFTFAAMTIDGEQPARYVRDSEKDYIDVWPDMEYIRAHIMGRQFGVKPIFMSEITAKNDPDGHLSRSLLALMLPHDVEIWDGAMPNRAPLRTWHKIKNDFNFLEAPSSFYPYWAKNKAAITDKDKVIVSIWKIKNRFLILLSNLGGETDVQISLKPDLLGIKDFTSLKLRDAENNSSVQFENNTFSAHVKRHDFRVFKIND